jgi:hypothetical protein
MASVTYGKYIHGLRDLKVTNLAGSTQEDLDAAMTLDFTPEWVTARFEGDDAVKAGSAFLIGGQAQVSAGAMSSAAIAIVTGKSLSTSGSTPNEITELQMNAGDRTPYFKIYGQAYDEITGDVHILLHKVKLFGGLQLKLENNTIMTNGFTLEVFDNGTNGVFELIQHETAAAVPTS